jgi:hypothetical protein
VPAPGTLLGGAAVVPLGAFALGTLAPGSGVVGMLAGTVGITLGAAAREVLVTVVTVVTAALAPEPELPARSTSAAPRAPSDSATSTANAMIGAFQFGAAARRVRAAAPQRRHHSCSRCNGVAHKGQASPGLAGGGGVNAGLCPVAGDGVEAAKLTGSPPAVA